MTAILLFSLRRRFTGYVKNAESTLSLLLRILYLAMLIFNAAMIGWLTDMADASDNFPMNANQFIRLVTLTFCGLWLFMAFFPSYTRRSNLVAVVFPVRFAKRWTANLLYDIGTITTVGIVAAFLLIDALSKTYTTTHLVTSLLLLGNTIVFVQLVKAFIEFRHRHGLLLVVVGLALAGIVVAAMLYRLPNSGLLISTLGICLPGQLALLFYADQSASAPIDSPVFVAKLSLFNRLSPVYAAFLNNPKSRTAFGFGLLLKALFLFFMGQPFTKASPMGEVISIIYVAPVILFTYVANNIWGFFPALWVNTTLGKRSDTYRIYFQLLSLPLLLDVLVTFGTCLYLGIVDAKLVAFYIFSTVALALNGLVFSLYKAFYVQNSFNFSQMKNNVNGWSTFSAMLLIGLMFLAIKTVWSAVLLGVALLAGGWYILIQLLPNHTDNRHILYRQLFVEND